MKNDIQIEKLLEFCVESISNTYNNEFNDIRGIVSATYVDDNGEKIIKTKNIKKDVDEAVFKGLKKRNVEGGKIDMFSEKAKTFQHKIDEVYFFEHLKNSVIKKDTSHFTKRVDGNLLFNDDGITWNIKGNLSEIKELKNKIHKFLLSRYSQNNEDDINKNKRGTKLNTNAPFVLNWKDLYYILNDHGNTGYYHNDFDLLFLFPNTKEIIFLPIPILSSVSMFAMIAVENGSKKQDIIKKWNELYIEMRSTVLHFVLGSILDKTKTYIEKEALELESEKFIEYYIKQVANYILPIGYCYNNKAENTFEDNSFCKYVENTYICRFNPKYNGNGNICPKYQKVMDDILIPADKLNDDNDKKKSILDFNLTLNKDKKEDGYSVRFFLPTFYYKIHLEEKSWLLKPFKKQKTIIKQIQDFQGFDFHKIVFKERLEDTFEILYKRFINEKQKVKQALLSAIAKVFLRTTAHNTGSHVLSRLVEDKQLDLDTLLSLINEQYQGYKINSTGNLQGSQKDIIISSIDGDYKLTTSEKETLKNNLNNGNYTDEVKKILRKFYKKQTGYFNSYLKTRMEFLADFVTGTPQTQNTKYFIKDIFALFQNNKIMLNRISGLNNFRFKFNIIFDGKNKDIQVAISNDILGQHAFYIILENIIRNTAKHSPAGNNGQDVEFTIKISNSTSYPYYRVLVYDNIDLSNKVVLQELIDGLEGEIKPENNTTQTNNGDAKSEAEKNKDSKKQRIEKQLKRLNSINNGKTLTEAHLKALELNTIIDCPILEEGNYQLRPDGMGMIEMMVSAAYLRKIPVEDVQKKKYRLIFDFEEEKEYKKKLKKREAELKIFRAIPVEDKYLGFQFYLPKPKELLIITENKNFGEDKLKKIENNGILVLDTNSESKLPDIYKYKDNHNYDQTLCILSTKSFNKCKTNKYLPTRKIIVDKIITSRKGKDPDYSEIILDAWKKATTEFYKNNNINPKDNSIIKITGNVTNFNNFEWRLARHGDLYTESGYYEVHGSDVKYIYDLFSKTLIQDKLLYTKFMYDAITNIVIFDERIQQYANTTSSTKIANNHNKKASYHQIWKQMNVYIPVSKDNLNLGQKNYDKTFLDKIKNIVQIFDKPVDKLSKKGVDIIVMHLGVLEKLQKVEGNQGKGIKELIDDIKGENEDIKFIITSGRGQPKNIPDDIPFISYSVLSQYLIEKRSKLLLTETLYLAKPKQL